MDINEVEQKTEEIVLTPLGEALERDRQLYVDEPEVVTVVEADRHQLADAYYYHSKELERLKGLLGDICMLRCSGGDCAWELTQDQMGEIAERGYFGQIRAEMNGVPTASPREGE